MKRTLISALLVTAAFATAPAFAQSSLTRADVQAQLVQAEQSGQLMQQRSRNDYPIDQVASNTGTTSRAEVKSELAKAESEGKLAQQVAPNDQPFIATATSANNGELTRAEVKRELAAARQAGLVPANQTNYPYDFSHITANQRTAMSEANPNQTTAAQTQD
jgi:Domain of unknown function (DUF4148)